MASKLSQLFKLLIVSKNEANLTSDIVFKLQCGFCNESYYRKCVRHLTVKMSEHIGVSNLPKSKLNLRTATQPIIYYFATIQHPVTILLF